MKQFNLALEKMVTYLEANDWSLETQREHSSTWANTKLNRSIFLPSAGVVDYRSRITDAIHFLAQISESTVEELYRHIQYMDYDIFKVRIINSDTPDAIDYEKALVAVKGVKDLIVNSAASVLNPRSQHPSSKPKKVKEVGKALKMGQTEQGSFVFNIYIPIDTEQETDELTPTLPEVDKPIPFGRQVTVGLMNGLSKLKSISDAEEVDKVDDLVKSGLSTNLCENVLSFIEDTEIEIEFALNWSNVIETPPDTPLLVHFQPQDAPFVKGAKERLAVKKNRDAELSATGFVVGLRHDPREDKSGERLVNILFQDPENPKEKPKEIRLALDEYRYTTALKAHEKNLPVFFSGELDLDAYFLTLTRVDTFSMPSLPLIDFIENQD